MSLWNCVCILHLSHISICTSHISIPYSPGGRWLLHWAEQISVFLECFCYVQHLVSTEDNTRQLVKVVLAIYLIQIFLTASNRTPHGLASGVYKKENNYKGTELSHWFKSKAYISCSGKPSETIPLRTLTLQPKVVRTDFI